MSLYSKTTRGIRWSATSYVGRQIMQFLSLAIFARLLTPSQFGLISMALVVVNFILIFKDLGTSAAIIQRRQLSQDLLSSVYWFNVLFGLATSIITFLIAPLVAQFYQDSQIIGILRVLSLVFFISSLSILHQTLLQREQKFNRLAIIELSATFLGATIGIVAAILNAGVWSLVIQAITYSSTNTLLLWLMNSWKPKMILRWVDVKSISNYSLNLTGFNITNYFARNLDNILIGKYLGSQSLGYYSVAYQIMLTPVQVVSNIVNRVMFPAYSQIQDDTPRFRRIYIRAAGAIALISFPLMLGIMVVNYPLIITIFGSKWLPVSQILLILAPVGMAQSIATTVGVIYQAKGRTDWMFRWGMFAGFVRMVAFIIGLRWGLIGVALGYAISSIILIYPGFAIPLSLIDMKVNVLFKALWKPLQYSLIMMIFVIGLRVFFNIIGYDNSLIILIACTLFGGSIYLGLLISKKPQSMRDVLSLLPPNSLGRLNKYMKLS